MLLPFGRAGVENEAAGAAGGVGVRGGDVERLPERIRRQRDRTCPGRAYEHPIRFQQHHGLAGVLGQQVAVGVQRIGGDAVGGERGDPLVQEHACDHRHAGARGLPDAPADSEVQIVDVIGEMLLERVRHQLRKLDTGLGRQLGLGEQHVSAGHQGAHAPAGNARGGEIERPALRRPHRGAARIHDQPGGRLLGRAWQSQEQRFSHVLILSLGRPRCASIVSLSLKAPVQSDVKLRCIGRTICACESWYKRLYKLNSELPIVTTLVRQSSSRSARTSTAGPGSRPRRPDLRPRRAGSRPGW